MKKLASIMCDGGGERKDYRRNIYLQKGRLICDGVDITPMVGKYPRGAKGTEMAIEDIRLMYGIAVWGLEWAE